MVYGLNINGDKMDNITTKSFGVEKHISGNTTRLVYLMNKLKELEKEIQAAASELPTIAVQDVGKALIVNDDGEAQWTTIPTEVPSHIGTDEGKMLSVDSSNALVWATVPTEIPTHTGTDEGKMLSVDSSNALVWIAVPTELPSTAEASAGYVLTFDGTNIKWAAIPTQE